MSLMAGGRLEMAEQSFFCQNPMAAGHFLCYMHLQDG
jgi:hypothetical protein